jgi:hypothetical protein
MAKALKGSAKKTNRPFWRKKAKTGERQKEEGYKAKANFAFLKKLSPLIRRNGKT